MGEKKSIKVIVYVYPCSFTSLELLLMQAITNRDSTHETYESERGRGKKRGK